MKKNATIQSIAEELNLSVSTVSRALNGLGEKYRISKKTIDAVNQTADKLSYSPNNIAKSLRLKKSSTIGLIVPDISNPWFANIALQIEKAARKKGYHILLCNSNDDVEQEKLSIDLMKNQIVDGLIVAPIGIEYEHIINVKKNGIPVILVDRFFENLDLAYVSANDFEGAFEAIEYLIKNGHKKIACIRGIKGTSTDTQRVNGYRKAMKKNKIEINPSIVIGKDFGFENGYHYTKKLIKNWNTNNITAIFSVSNQISLGALKALKEDGIKVPDQISIISFDEQNYSDLLYTPLTTISHLDENVGEKAFEMLFKFIEEKELPHSCLFPTKLIIRESVKTIESIL